MGKSRHYGLISVGIGSDNIEQRLHWPCIIPSELQRNYDVNLLEAPALDKLPTLLKKRMRGVGSTSTAADYNGSESLLFSLGWLVCPLLSIEKKESVVSVFACYTYRQYLYLRLSCVSYKLYLQTSTFTYNVSSRR